MKEIADANPLIEQLQLFEKNIKGTLLNFLERIEKLEQIVGDLDRRIYKLQDKDWSVN